MKLWYTSTSHLHTYHLIISVSCALQPQPLGNNWRKRFNAWPNGFQFGNDDWHRESNKIPTINPATPWHQHHITSNTKRRRFRSSAWPVNMSKLSMQLALMSLDPSSEMITPRQFAGFADSTTVVGRTFQTPNHIHGQQPMLKSLKWKHQHYKFTRCMTPKKPRLRCNHSISDWHILLYLSEFSHRAFLRQ